MRHRKSVEKLARPTDQRMALLKGLVSNVLVEGFVDTSLARARSAQAITESVISLGRKGTLSAFRRLATYINGKRPFNALKREVLPNLPPNKESGFTKLIRLKRRRGDGAVIARLFIPTHPKFKQRLEEE